MKKKSKIKISSTYANAWFDGAEDNKELEKAFADCSMLELSITPEDIKDLSSPILSDNLRKEIIDEIVKKLKLSSSTCKVLSTLCENKRLKHLKEIFGDFKSLYYKHKDIVEVFVQTVKPLSKEQNDKLKSNIEKILDKKTVLNYEIRPDILGGLKIKYETYEIDDSIKGKLIKIESIMKGSK